MPNRTSVSPPVGGTADDSDLTAHTPAFTEGERDNSAYVSIGAEAADAHQAAISNAMTVAMILQSPL